MLIFSDFSSLFYDFLHLYSRQTRIRAFFGSYFGSGSTKIVQSRLRNTDHNIYMIMFSSNLNMYVHLFQIIHQFLLYIRRILELLLCHKFYPGDIDTLEERIKNYFQLRSRSRLDNIVNIVYKSALKMYGKGSKMNFFLSGGDPHALPSQITVQKLDWGKNQIKMRKNYKKQIIQKRFQNLEFQNKTKQQESFRNQIVIQDFFLRINFLAGYLVSGQLNI